MTKDEFENLAAFVSQANFDVIENVYKNYPVNIHPYSVGKMATLYNTFGMIIFHDMMQRVKKTQKMEEKISELASEVCRLKEELNAAEEILEDEETDKELRMHGNIYD